MISRRHLTAAAALFAVAAPLLGCNDHKAIFQSSSGAVVESRPVAIQAQVPMDILWVIDNSFSMCEEQQLLRENFRGFINILEDTNLDFHLAVTTTHVPYIEYKSEPLAKASVIQALPQPVPAPSTTCFRTTEAQRMAGAEGDFEPVRQALALAKSCLADPSLASNYEWTDPQIECAYSEKNSPLRVGGCVDATGIPDTDGNNFADEFDLFPSEELYRGLRGGGKVIRAEAYRDASGELDAAALSADFACMATAGTLGTGYEKGLRAAVDAVSPEFTGYAVESDMADSGAPNHGFLRQDAQFALIFVTDENDCSNIGGPTGIQEEGDQCGGGACYYWNSSQFSEAETPLTPISELAAEFRENLARSKGYEPTPEGLEALEDQLLISSIHGAYDRFTGTYPVCDENLRRRDVIEAACTPQSGPVDSGDRYERFIRQFKSFYPNLAAFGGEDPDLGVVGAPLMESSEEEIKMRLAGLGSLCADFAEALQGIANFIVSDSASCITDNVLPCEGDMECPTRLITNEAGTCTQIGDSERSYCDTGILLKLERDLNRTEARFPDLNDHPYCVPGSVGLPSLPPSRAAEAQTCIVKPDLYSFESCGGDQRPGIKYAWNQDEATVQSQLSGYNLDVVFKVTP